MLGSIVVLLLVKEGLFLIAVCTHHFCSHFMGKDSVTQPFLISKETGTYEVPGRRRSKYDEHLAKVCHEM